MIIQNELYSYYDNIIYEPTLFNYLSFEIQDEIKNFIKEYSKFYTQFIIFLQSKNNKEFRKFEYETIYTDKYDEYLKYGNYLNKEGVQGELNEIPNSEKEFLGYSKIVVIKITDEEYNHLNCMIQKIIYLIYNESLKYGYKELDN